MMKAQDARNNDNGQGRSTSDRAFMDQKNEMKQRGVSNGGGQRSDQTSNRDNDRKHENKRH